jgi:hypothetical protein
VAPHPEAKRVSAPSWGRDAGQDFRARLLNVFERLSQRVLVSVVELHVVGGCGMGIEPDGLTDHGRREWRRLISRAGGKKRRRDVYT